MSFTERELRITALEQEIKLMKILENAPTKEAITIVVQGDTGAIITPDETMFADLKITARLRQAVLLKRLGELVDEKPQEFNRGGRDPVIKHDFSSLFSSSPVGGGLPSHGNPPGLTESVDREDVARSSQCGSDNAGGGGSSFKVTPAGRFTVHAASECLGCWQHPYKTAPDQSSD